MGAWTWFSGEPIHIYGIQWLPAWTHMNYLFHTEHSVFQLNQMMERQGKGKGGITWETIDGDWGGYRRLCRLANRMKFAKFWTKRWPRIGRSQVRSTRGFHITLLMPAVPTA